MSTRLLIALSIICILCVWGIMAENASKSEPQTAMVLRLKAVNMDDLFGSSANWKLSPTNKTNALRVIAWIDQTSGSTLLKQHIVEVSNTVTGDGILQFGYLFEERGGAHGASIVLKSFGLGRGTFQEIDPLPGQVQRSRMIYDPLLDQTISTNKTIELAVIYFMSDTNTPQYVLKLSCSLVSP